ncbi:MAG: hypothetical protein HY815_28145, partial [Candidatus Riflebacteria bacterium]|nr:hypothetical protein [Candidatus Riflebacteria bacterium]
PPGARLLPPPAPPSSILPAEADPLFVADEYVVTDRPADALVILEWLASRGVPSTRLLTLQARALADLGRTTEALDIARKAATSAPRDVACVRTLVDVAEKAGAAREVDQAIARWRELAPKDQAAARRELAIREKRGDSAGVVDARRHLVTLCPDDPTETMLLGQALAQTGAKQEARRALDRALLAGHRQIVPCLGVARGYADLALYDEALALLHGAVKRWPTRVEPLLSLGSVLSERGDFGSARRRFLQSAALAPTSAHPWVALGRLSLARGHVHAARRELQHAKRLGPGLAVVKTVGQLLDNHDGVPVARGVAFRGDVSRTLTPRQSDAAVFQSLLLYSPQDPESLREFVRPPVDEGLQGSIWFRIPRLPSIRARVGTFSTQRAFVLFPGKLEDLSFEEAELELGGTLPWARGPEISGTLSVLERSVLGTQTPDLVAEKGKVASAGIVITPWSDRFRVVSRVARGSSSRTNFVLSSEQRSLALEVRHRFPSWRTDLHYGLLRDNTELTPIGGTFGSRRLFALISHDWPSGRRLQLRWDTTRLTSDDPARITTPLIATESRGPTVRYDHPIGSGSLLGLWAGRTNDMTAGLVDRVTGGAELVHVTGATSRDLRLTLGAGIADYPQLDSRSVVGHARAETRF